MTSRRWSTIVSGFVLTTAMAAGGPAHAQWGFPVTSGFGAGGYSGSSPYDYGSYGGYGVAGGGGYSVYDLGSTGGLGYGGFAGIGSSSLPGYAESSGQVPMTGAFQSAEVVTRVPRWGGPMRRLRRRR